MLSALLAVGLVINEVMASNAGVVMSPATNFDSWIEIYNPTDQPVQLSGMYLSDSPGNPRRWQLPASIGTVSAHGYKVLWLGSSDIRNDQAPFKLDCDGGIVCLSDASGQLVAAESYPEAMSRTAWARTTDGGSTWGWTAQPTPGVTNATSAFATERLPAPKVSTDSRLFSSSLSVRVAIPDGATLMYTTDGSLPTAPKPDGQESSPWTNQVVNGDCEGTDASCLISHDADSSDDVERIVDGVGIDGSRGIKVRAKDNPQNNYDAQFFVYTSGHVWQAGEHFRFSMMVRADKPTFITTQSHRTPHDYIAQAMLANRYDITTEWQKITFEGTISAEQAGTSGGGWWGQPAVSQMQTIAFNLNEESKANNFYFDNIVWESYVGTAAVESSQQSTNGIFNISKTTNLTLRFFQEGKLPSVPVTRSYIKTDNKYTLPIVSIVGDKKHFTDPKIGIDCDGDGTNGRTGNGQDHPRNYNQDWDRPVNLSLLSPEGKMLFNQDANIKVSGGFTRSQRFRSFKVKASKAFDGQNRFDYAFFPQKPFIRNKTLLLRNGGNDVWTHNARFIDAALETIVQRSGLDLDVQSCVPVIEYVNGELRGVFNLREPNNDDFAYANWGYDDEELDAFENQVMKNGDDAVLRRIYELGARVGEAGAYEELCQLLDIDEFTNYMATTMYLDNDDWPNNNMKAYRSRNDGRYRFVSFDLDYAFALRGFNKYNDNPFTYFEQFKDAESVGGEGNYNREVVRLLLRLLGHEGYRRKFVDTFCLVAGSVFEPGRASAIVDELLARVQPMTQLMKQQGINDGHAPERAASTIKSRLSGRASKMADHLRNWSYAGLSGVAKQQVRLGSDTEGATLMVNGIEVPYGQFDGYLFAPVTLSAKAPAGYRFAGWRNAASATVGLIALGDSWRYFDKGLLPSSWRNNSYSDATWAMGASPLGYTMAGVKTVVGFGADANRKNPTTYFRKTVTLSAKPANSDRFTLSYQVDDGFIVYVNGTEAGRVNMPTGNVAFDTFSSSYAADEPITGMLNLDPMLFRAGDNLIAVEVHNNNYTSSDLYWACELTTSVGASTSVLGDISDEIALPQGNLVSLTACFTPLTAEELMAQGVTPVRVNEVGAANDIYVNDYFKRNDWVELYNTTDLPIDVEGMYLSDNADKPTKYQIGKAGGKATTVIEPHGYLVVWCDKLEPLSQLHASFKLDGDGGDVVLTAADQSWSDRLSYGLMAANQTAGRYPDGGSRVYLMNIPTIGQANVVSSYVEPVVQRDEAGIHDMAALATNPLTVAYSGSQLIVGSPVAARVIVSIASLAGQQVSRTSRQLSTDYCRMGVDHLAPGIYVATVSDDAGHKATCKFIKR